MKTKEELETTKWKQWKRYQLLNENIGRGRDYQIKVKERELLPIENFGRGINYQMDPQEMVWTGYQLKHRKGN